MRDAATLVREFHVAMGAPVADKLQKLGLAAARLRLSLILEEVGELAEALGSDGTVTGGIEDAKAMLEHDGFDSPASIVEAADALADIEYVTAGTAVEMGIPLGLVLSEVHRSNLTKVGGKMRADGKIGKGPGYEPPRIAEVLGLVPPFEYPAPCEGGFAQCDVAVSAATFIDPKGRPVVNARLAAVETGPRYIVRTAAEMVAGQRCAPFDMESLAAQAVAKPESWMDRLSWLPWTQRTPGGAVATCAIIDTRDPVPAVTGDPVAWPSHYMAGGYECREVIAALGLNHPRGNAFKYLWRAGKKDGADVLVDLRKARECIDFDIRCEEAKRQ